MVVVMKSNLSLPKAAEKGQFTYTLRIVVRMARLSPPPPLARERVCEQPPVKSNTFRQRSHHTARGSSVHHAVVKLMAMGAWAKGCMCEISAGEM